MPAITTQRTLVGTEAMLAGPVSVSATCIGRALLPSRRLVLALIGPLTADLID